MVVGGDIGYKIHTKKVALTDTFMTSVEELYDTFITEQVNNDLSLSRCPNALLLSQLVEAFTRSKAVINAHKGGSFSILDGKVTGEFVELVCTISHAHTHTMLSVCYRLDRPR